MVAPGEVRRVVSLVRHALLDHEAAVEAERALEEERRPFTADAADQRPLAPLTLPRQERDLPVERDRLAAVGRLVVRAGKELLPAARVAVEERRPFRTRGVQTPRRLKEQFGLRRDVDERVQLRTALGEHDRAQHVVSHRDGTPAGDAPHLTHPAASPG